MEIKKMLVILGLVGFAGGSSYAMAQSHVFRTPVYGVKASSIGSEEGNAGDVGGGEETPENNLTTPSDFYFSENNDQLSGNVGDAGTVTIYDEVGNQVGQTTADENGDFTSPIGTEISGGDLLEVVVTNGNETLSSNVTVPISLTEPTDIVFNESGEQLSANVGDDALITVRDNSGIQIGQTNSNSDGEFSVSLTPAVSTDDILELDISDGSNTITVSITVPDNIGWLDDTVWREYGIANGFNISSHDKENKQNSYWHSLPWNYAGLSNLPTEPYPLREIDRPIQLGGNYIEQIDGFRNVVKADRFNFENNSLTNLNGLSSLIETGGLRLYNNQISDISGLSSLERVVSSLELQNNNLTNVDALSNLKSAFKVLISNNDLSNVNGLSSLIETNGISLAGNPNLIDISGLRNIESVQYEGLSLDISMESDIAQRDGFVGIPNTSWLCQGDPVVDLRGPDLSEICVE
ncbi:Ig-like domain-containing protein [Halovibrio sp. HP20-50]|uniref:Ig-like domain-containing protein n=1 Tax=Halovibrio sp. HP20-59 TaxID=3080275 RepID=UPI00294B6463|nr:Ig-like domain-containing protein [Halovibrio sp. HP20-59]MEA2117928.1 Ig-like domain-containing protein [Halovibrio sp. HP20-59]